MNQRQKRGGKCLSKKNVQSSKKIVEPVVETPIICPVAPDIESQEFKRKASLFHENHQKGWFKDPILFDKPNVISPTKQPFRKLAHTTPLAKRLNRVQLNDDIWRDDTHYKESIQLLCDDKGKKNDKRRSELFNHLQKTQRRMNDKVNKLSQTKERICQSKLKADSIEPTVLGVGAVLKADENVWSRLESFEEWDDQKQYTYVMIKLSKMYPHKHSSVFYEELCNKKKKDEPLSLFEKRFYYAYTRHNQNFKHPWKVESGLILLLDAVPNVLTDAFVDSWNGFSNP